MKTKKKNEKADVIKNISILTKLFSQLLFSLLIFAIVFIDTNRKSLSLLCFLISSVIYKKRLSICAVLSRTFFKVNHWTQRMLNQLLSLSDNLFTLRAFLTITFRSKCRVNKTTSCKKKDKKDREKTDTPLGVVKKGERLNYSRWEPDGGS